jgi:hypothetical protein
MAKMGRPKAGEPRGETELVRASPELKQLLSDLALVHPKTTAQLLDQFALIEVRELHARFKPLIDKAKATSANAEATLQKLADEAAKLDRQASAAPPLTEPAPAPGRRPKPGS